MGRYRMRRRGLFEAENREDGQAVRDALETVGLWELRNRTANTLSGGQQQRVFLARVFAQQPEIVMLDEPTNHLDLSSQIELMQQLRLYGSQPNRQVIGVFRCWVGRQFLCAKGRFSGRARFRTSRRRRFCSRFTASMCGRIWLRHWKLCRKRDFTIQNSLTFGARRIIRRIFGKRRVFVCKN